MKKIRIITAVLAFAFAMTSCESFFDVELDDQAKIEELFTQRQEVHKYLSHLYSYIPMEEETVHKEGTGWVVPRSDEALYSWYQWVAYPLFKTGSYSSATTDFNWWPTFYIAINQCSTFLKYVDLDKGDTQQVITYMKAEARFLRAYYYFCLFRQYGPVFIWGDQMADETIVANTVDRHTVQQNVDFMVGELDAIKNDLPIRVGDTGESENEWVGRVTRGAALALKSRILLYAASPLYNGCDLYKGKMQNIRGEYLFPQSKDENKWTLAAEAAKAVIDLKAEAGYDLCKVTAEGNDKMLNGIRSYQDVIFKNWNSETIWGWWYRSCPANVWLGRTGGEFLSHCLPIIKQGDNIAVYWGIGGICPSLKLIDSYPMMESGRYPVKGYEGQNDLSKPIIDPKSGYQNTGFTEGYIQPDASWSPAIKAHNSCVGRDPRYYACLLPNGFMWPDVNTKIIYTNYNSPDCTARWQMGETDGICRVGYIWRRLYKADTKMVDANGYTSLKYVYPAFRLAEIYLNYAEACNEKPERDEDEAFKYLNMVRDRVGLNKIEVAYPEIKGDKELLRWCIQKERMVEFGLEAMRHYDACRWMIAKDEYPGANWTLNLSADNYEQSYNRVSTDYVGGNAVFRDQDYLYPINSTQLAEMVNMTQNYGF